MSEGLTLLDVLYGGGRLLSLASLIYFFYLLFRACKVMDLASPETLHHLVRRERS